MGRDAGEPLALCPECGHQYTPRAACLRCGYDPFAGRGALSPAFGDLTPVGRARQEGVFIATLPRLALRRLGVRRE